MAAMIKTSAKPGENPVLKGYRIHEDHIRNVARTFVELYHTRRPHLLPAGHAGKKLKQGSETALGTTHTRVSKTIWGAGPVQEAATHEHDEKNHDPIIPPSPITAVRCYHCGVNFPVADFLYTKRSGLCIDCWEEMVV